MERFPAGWARSAPHLPGETNWVQIVDFPLWAVLRYRLPGSSERRGDFAKAFFDSLPVSNPDQRVGTYLFCRCIHLTRPSHRPTPS